MTVIELDVERLDEFREALSKLIKEPELFKEVAEGNSGLVRTIFEDGTRLAVERSYEGDLNDRGEPGYRTFVWDPWSDPVIEKTPCCYLVALTAWDRAIVNNYYGGGHHDRDFEAVEIAL